MFPINGLNPPLYGLTETKGSGLSSKRPRRTPSWLSAYVKWGRTPLAEDILISSVRGGGAELGRC